MQLPKFQSEKNIRYPAIILLLAALALAGGCATETPQISNSTEPNNTMDEHTKTQAALTETASGNATLLDVRTLEEWDGGHFKGAVHIPLDQIAMSVDGSDLTALDKSKRIYTYCARGLRATTASEKLESMGFESIPLQSTFKRLRKSGFQVAE